MPVFPTRETVPPPARFRFVEPSPMFLAPCTFPLLPSPNPCASAVPLGGCENVEHGLFFFFFFFCWVVFVFPLAIRQSKWASLSFSGVGGYHANLVFFFTFPKPWGFPGEGPFFLVFFSEKFRFYVRVSRLPPDKRSTPFARRCRRSP